jgi:hypothetical protein
MPTADRRSPEANALLQDLDPAAPDVIEALRTILLDETFGLTEGVKWNAPSYALDGDDRITFNFRGKGGIRLVFHCGAKKRAVKAAAPLIDERALEWADNERALATFMTVREVNAKREWLQGVIKRWLAAA